jgi:uncharacterized protein
LALYNSFYQHLNSVAWGAAFVAGLAGSLHCIGMCGGLVTASTRSTSDIAIYQVGRLLAYMILGFMAGSLGQVFKLQNIHPILSYLPTFFIGALFILWGLSSLWQKSFHVPLPKFLQKFYQHFWIKAVNTKAQMWRSFVTGFISIFLPCGFLYGIILGTIALQNAWLSSSVMFFFWLGTLPSMSLAPKMVQKVLSPLKKQRPKIYAFCLIFLGLITISWRSTALDLKVKSTVEPQASCH